MKPWFVIRADADSDIGLGHVMRCLALAEWAKYDIIEAVLLSTSVPKALAATLSQLTISTLELTKNDKASSETLYAHSHWLAGTEQQDAENTLELIEQQVIKRGVKPLFIMVDHYALAAPWERKLARIAKVLAVDDLCDRPHHCSWLVDQTLGRSEDDYQRWVNPECQLKIGPEYALLRTEFKEARGLLRRTEPNPQILLRVLITLGGVDVDNVTGQVLRLLAEASIIDKLLLTVVAGGSNPHIKELSELVGRIGCQAKLIVNSQDMATLMSEHHICIGAAGATSWERCTLGLPTLNLVLAENQRLIAANLNHFGVAKNLGDIAKVNTAQLDQLLYLFHNDHNVYMQQVELSLATCDGMGCERILQIVTDVCNG